MKLTKTLTLTAALVAGLATTNAEIKLTDDLSLSGYIYTHADIYASDSTESNIGTSVELETILDYKVADTPFSFHAELAFIGTDAAVGGDIQSENIFLAYQATDQLSFGAGRLLSYQGYDTFDQNTRAQRSFGWLSNNSPYYEAFATGVMVNYDTADYAIGGRVYEGADDTDDLALEVRFQYTGIEGLLARAIFAYDADYKTTYNVWAAYTVGDTTFGAEFITNQYDGGEDTTAYMATVTQAFGDYGVTARFAATEDDSEGQFTGQKYTIAPYYKVTDSFTLRGEVTLEEYDDLDDTVTYAAVEAFLTF